MVRKRQTRTNAKRGREDKTGTSLENNVGKDQINVIEVTLERLSFSGREVIVISN